MSATNPHVEVATAVLAACEAAQTALEAINAALITGNRLGVVTPGFHHLMATRGPLGALVAEHGPAVALSKNELAAAVVTG